jgi:hypothetical protein
MVVMKHKVFQMGIPSGAVPRPGEPGDYPRSYWERWKQAYHAASRPIERYDSMLDEVEAFINAIGMENVVSFRERFLWGRMIVTVWYRAEVGSPYGKPSKASMAEL